MTASLRLYGCRSEPDTAFVMTKREFLKIAAATVATGWPFAAQTRRTKNWCWMRPRLTVRPDEMRREFAAMKSAGVDAILPEVYNGREALFQSRRFPVKAAWLESAIPAARAEGLEVHAWMWCMPCLLPEIIRAHADWYNVNAKGESAVDKPAYVDYYKFLDPARPEVREFVRATVQELAAIPDLAGIHLDYIRHPDAILPSGLWSKYGIVQDRVYPQYDYGYTEYSRRIFKARHGIDPIEIPDPESHREWMQYRLDTVVDLVNEFLVPTAHAGGKMITAAVFPGPGRARAMVRQDWGRFRLDAFLPMLYHTFYEAGPEFVRDYTREAVATVKAPVYSGLFVSPLDAPALTRTVEMAFAGGASGVSIFDAGAMNADRWQTLAKAIAR
jgi:uncharacterized lipoprotein YddW (UPF0748 family)